MNKIIFIFILLALSGCSAKSICRKPIVTDAIDTTNTKALQVLSTGSTTNAYKPEVQPMLPREANFTEITLLLNGIFRNPHAKDIEGEVYLSIADFVYIFETILPAEENTDWHSILLQNDSLYNINGVAFFPLNQIAEEFGLRLNWVHSRNTVIIALPEQLTTEPIFTAEAVPPHIIEQITNSSFHENAHFDISHLAYLTVTHIDFYGKSRIGHIIVANSIAEEVLDIFREIYQAQFPIERIRLIDYYGADDYYSMADNNSVGFNFRYISGTTTLSRHAWGMAIDINPVQNPFIRGDILWPVSGADYMDRTNVREGMILVDDAVYNAFTSRGWIWGGHWTLPIDYHHFERR